VCVCVASCSCVFIHALTVLTEHLCQSVPVGSCAAAVCAVCMARVSLCGHVLLLCVLNQTWCWRARSCWSTCRSRVRPVQHVYTHVHSASLAAHWFPVRLLVNAACSVLFMVWLRLGTRLLHLGGTWCWRSRSCWSSCRGRPLVVLCPHSAPLASLRVPVLLPMLAWQAWLLFVVCLYTCRCSLFSECSAGLMCSRHFGVCCRRHPVLAEGVHGHMHARVCRHCH
jgi:hypothetical protein